MDLGETTQNKNRHPWELSRSQGLFNIIKRYGLESVADIGSGDRYFTSKIKSIIPGIRYAVDTGYDLLSENIDGIICLNDISLLPILDDNSGIIMMDVLEHVEDDAMFLGDIIKKLPNGGYIFITVPAFQFLFSSHDRFLKHLRRYERKSLLNLVCSQNLHVLECRYFYISLFFVRTLEKLFKGNGDTVENDELYSGVGKWRFRETHILTRVIRAVLDIDFYICGILAKIGIYPPGLSLLAVCKKI